MFLLSEKLQNIKCNLQILSRKVQNSMKFQNNATNNTKQISSNSMICADINIDFVGKRGIIRKVAVTSEFYLKVLKYIDFLHII